MLCISNPLIVTCDIGIINTGVLIGSNIYTPSICLCAFSCADEVHIELVKVRPAAVVDSSEHRFVISLVTPVAVGLIVVNLILDLGISFLLLRSSTSKFIFGVSVLKEVFVCKVIEDHERIFLTVDSATD